MDGSNEGVVVQQATSTSDDYDTVETYDTVVVEQAQIYSIPLDTHANKSSEAVTSEVLYHQPRFATTQTAGAVRCTPSNSVLYTH